MQLISGILIETRWLVARIAIKCSVTMGWNHSIAQVQWILSMSLLHTCYFFRHHIRCFSIVSNIVEITWFCLFVCCVDVVPWTVVTTDIMPLIHALSHIAHIFGKFLIWSLHLQFPSMVTLNQWLCGQSTGMWFRYNDGSVITSVIVLISSHHFSCTTQ